MDQVNPMVNSSESSSSEGSWGENVAGSDSDVLVRVEGVGKVFCRDLKKSLMYGVQDGINEFLPWKRNRFDIPEGTDAADDRYRKGLRSGEFWAVRNVSFELRRGECLALIGGNGAGKTTLLKMLNGLVKPDIGKIEMRGRVGALIALGAGFNPILSGRENIYVNGSVLGLSRAEIDDKLEEIIDFAEVRESIDSPLQSYSSGMQVRLGFAIASSMNPDILLLDEVLAVGDVGFRTKCLNRVDELLQRTAVIFVSHTMPYVARICTQGILMRKGVNIFSSREISDVINHYNREFQMGERRITGTNEIKIENVKLNGEGGDAMPVIPFGGPLKLCMKLLAQTQARKLSYRLIVWSVDQRPVLTIVGEDYRPFTSEDVSERAELAIEVPELHLASGKYSVTITVSDDATTKILCRYDNAAAFVMGHHIATGAEVLQLGQWILSQ